MTWLIVTGADVLLWPPIIVLVISSAIGLVYYLRIVATMYSPLDQASVKALPPASVTRFCRRQPGAGSADVAAAEVRRGAAALVQLLMH
jgi:hypothetical protein